MTMASAQFDFGGGATTPPKKAWEEFRLNPKTRVTLAFRNAGIDNIISLFQRTSGITIVKDPSLTGGLTVTSAKPVSLAQAFQILSTTLSLKGFELAKEENLLVIRKRDQGGNRGGFPTGGFPQTGGFPGGFPGGQSETLLRVYPIQFANASQVARVLNEVFQQQQGGGFPGGFPGGGGRFQGGGGGGGRGNQGGFPGNFRFGGATQQTVRASADDFSNSVIVNAPDREQGQVRDLIRQLDKQTEEPQQPIVYRLEFASAEEVQPVIQNVLTSNAPRGRGGATTQQAQGPQAFLNALRGNVAGAGSVTADPRTNSLVVTATGNNQQLVAKVIKELDTEVKTESSTFVFPLENARADQVAGLLNQAFGQRQGVGNFGGNRFGQGTNAQQRNNRNNRNGGGGGGGLGGGLRSQQDPEEAVAEQQAKELELALQDPNADQGELLTKVGVAQIFGGGQGGFGGFGGNRARQTAQTARDAQGRVVNSRDLTGQVTTIADPNTNSIIIVTTPENAELIRGILNQLDRIPEQVMIETIIVEASLDANDKLGVEWRFSQTKDGVTTTGQTDFRQQTNPPQEGFRFTLTGGNLTAFVNALKTDEKFQVLSTPRIFTSNNVESEINISQSVPYVLNSRQDANGNFTFNYAFLDVGVILNVTPRITSNGYVTMDITQTANELQGYTSFNAPIVNQRQADTTVSVKDGETVILGGIIRNTVTSNVRKVPLLGDIPILGNLFKSTSKRNQKTELLVFLTPRVVRNEEEARRLREESQKQINPEQRKTVENEIKRAGNTLGGGTDPSKNVPPPDPKDPNKKNGGN